jgi:hypothetical protein
MRLLSIFSTILFICLTNCQRPNSRKMSKITTINNQTSDIHFIPADSNQFYFPIKAFNDNLMFVGEDTFFVKWYSKHLYAMREPVIFLDKSQNEIYRFTWLRTFHNPIAIRIEKHGENYNVYWKLCSGAGGYEPGKLIIDKQNLIVKNTWDKFIDQLQQIDFWHMDTKVNTMGLDGSQWILEGKNLNQYHIVDRWSPNYNSEFYKCCDFLITLTDLKIVGQDKY